PCQRPNCRQYSPSHSLIMRNLLSINGDFVKWAIRRTLFAHKIKLPPLLVEHVRTLAPRLLMSEEESAPRQGGDKYAGRFCDPSRVELVCVTPFRGWRPSALPPATIWQPFRLL